MGVGVYTRTVLISTTMSAYIKVQARWLTCDNYAHRSSSRHCRPIYTSEPEIIPRRRHIGPHPDAILLCRQQPVALLLRSGHASSLQILTFGISPIPSQSSWLSFHLVWLASLLSSMRMMCPSHLNILTLIIRSNFSTFVCILTSSFRTLSFHVISIGLFVVEICDVLLPSFLLFDWQRP